MLKKSSCRFLLRAVLVSLFFFGFFQSPAHALLDKEDYTETEKAGFAFYKLGHIKPDFRKWVVESEAYKKSTLSQRDLLMQRKTYQLERGFSLYSPDEDLIKVSGLAMLGLPKLEDTNKDGEEPSPYFELMLNDTQSAYFPFPLGRDWIAVVPAQFDMFEHVPIDKELYTKMANVLQFGIYFNRRMPVMLEVYFQPFRVDTRKPIQLDGQDMWLMMANVANLEIWDPKHRTFLWGYTAPWYTTSRSNELLNLYDR